MMTQRREEGSSASPYTNIPIPATDMRSKLLDTIRLLVTSCSRSEEFFITSAVECECDTSCESSNSAVEHDMVCPVKICVATDRRRIEVASR